MRTLLYLSGEPGTGKTTLMAALTARWTQWAKDADERGPARTLFEVDRRPVAVELGRRRGTFSGTDALPSAVILTAVPFLAQPEADLVLAEGARLANRRFLSAAVDAGYRVVLIHLSNPAIAAARRAKRAMMLRVPEQNPSWVKGRRTAAANLADAAAAVGCTVAVLDAGDPTEVQCEIIGTLIPALAP